MSEFYRKIDGNVLEVNHLLKDMGEILEEDLSDINPPNIQFEDFSESVRRERGELERKTEGNASKKQILEAITPFFDSYLRRTHSHYVDNVVKINQELQAYPKELRITLAHELTHFVDKERYTVFWNRCSEAEKKWLEAFVGWIDSEVTPEEMKVIYRNRMHLGSLSEGRAIFVEGEIAKNEGLRDIYDLFNKFDCVFFPEYQLRVHASKFIERLKREGYAPILVIQNIPTYEEIEAVDVETYLRRLNY